LTNRKTSEPKAAEIFLAATKSCTCMERTRPAPLLLTLCRPNQKRAKCAKLLHSKKPRREAKEGGKEKKTQGIQEKYTKNFPFSLLTFRSEFSPEFFHRALRITLSTLGKIQFHLPICRRWQCPGGRGTYHIRANFWHCKVQHFSRWSLLKMHSKMKRKTRWGKKQWRKRVQIKKTFGNFEAAKC